VLRFFFLFATASRPSLGPTQPIKWVPGTLSPEVKRWGREADHSPPSSAEFKNAWGYTSALPIRFMVQGFVLNVTLILKYGMRFGFVGRR
jgi:hypothetical protein